MSAVCTHTEQIRIVELPAAIAGCEDCLATGGRWVHLRMCMSCGKIGCCDSSPNRHASKHAHADGHPILRSAEPGEDWSWCVIDEVAFVVDGVAETLPELPYADWEATKQTLHLYAQIVGKVKLATTQPRNHWWNVPLYVDVRGLTTRRLTHGDVSFDLTFDFVDHRLVLRTDRGVTSGFALEDGLTVAAFDANLHRLLREHGLDVEIVESPYRDLGHDAVSRGRGGRQLRRASTSSATGWRCAGPTPSSTSSPAGSAASRAPSISSGTASTSPIRASPAAALPSPPVSTRSTARRIRTR